MSGFYLDATDPAVAMVFEKAITAEVALRGPLFDPANGFAGESEDSLIQIKNDLTQKPGSKIRTYLRYQLDSRGRAQNEPLEGHMDHYKVATFDVEVNTLRNAVEISSPMFGQWVPFDVLDEAKNALADWFAQRFEFSAHLHAAGINIISSSPYNFNNTVQALNSNYIVRPGGKAAGTLTAGDIFTLDLLNVALQRLKLLRPRIRRCQTPVGKAYVCFLAPEQVTQLRESNSTWFATMQNALAGGRLNDNPLFTNALGMWNGVLFFESDFVPPGLNAAGDKLKDNTRRAWIGGAQALVLAFGRGYAPPGYSLSRFSWDRQGKDFGHQQQIAVTTIGGIARPRYTKPGETTASEAGVIVIETWAEHGLTSSSVYAPWIDAGASVE